MIRIRTTLFLSLIALQMSVWAQTPGAGPKFYEAEEFPAKNAKIQAESSASSGTYVTGSRLDTKFYSLSNVPIPKDWNQVQIWIRIRDCAVQLKTKDEQGAKQQLKVVRDASPDSWKWYDLGSYKRGELGEFIKFVRIPGGSGGLDAIFLNENSSIDPNTVADFSKFRMEDSK